MCRCFMLNFHLINTSFYTDAYIYFRLINTPFYTDAYYDLEEQSDQGLHCLPFCLHRLDSLLYGRATWFKF